MPVYESSLSSFFRMRVRLSPTRSDGARRAQFSEMQSHYLRAIEVRHPRCQQVFSTSTTSPPHRPEAPRLLR
jgi:hypothetical protein